MQIPLFETVNSDWKCPSLVSLPEFKRAKRIGIDIETNDPHLKTLGPGARQKDSFIAGISIALEDGPKFYLPLRHDSGGNMPDIDKALAYVRDNAIDFSGELVGANLQYDLDFLSVKDNIRFEKAEWYRDVLVADALINELHSSYKLDSVAKRWGFEGKDETVLYQAASDYKILPKDVKKYLWKLPAKFVGQYAEMDAWLPLEILKKQQHEIDKQNLNKIFNLESRVLRVLFKMRQRGVLVDERKLAEIVDWAYKKEEEALAFVKQQTGHCIKVGDVMNANKLVPALEHIGAKVGKTDTGKPNVDNKLFESIKHPVSDALARARKVNKLRTTFAESVYNHMTDGRIHCSYNQTVRQDDDSDDTEGAKYGRLSCSHPNLQQQPARDEFAKMWRSIYLPNVTPGDGKIWAANDFSQQEPRLLVDYALRAQHLIGPGPYKTALSMATEYTNNPNADSYDIMMKLAEMERKPVKAIYLGKCYGMGGAKLARSINKPTMRAVWSKSLRKIVDANSPEGISARLEGASIFDAAGEEAAAIIEKFDSTLSYIRAMAQATDRHAKDKGFIRTILGRRCRFPVDAFGNYEWTHKALNRLIQGSGGDQTKLAMCLLSEAGFDLIIQVHDEVGLGIYKEEEAREAAHIMATCIPTTVPFRVDVEMGSSWGESMK